MPLTFSEALQDYQQSQFSFAFASQTSESPTPHPQTGFALVLSSSTRQSVYAQEGSGTDSWTETAGIISV